MKRKCIISLANNRGNYYAALERLEKSLEGKFDGTFIGYRDEESVGAPKHEHNPYAFKLFCFADAIRQGFNQILWLDSSVYAIRDVSPVFDIIDREGYIMQEAGCFVGEWCNDRGLDAFKWSRDKAMTKLCYGNAGLLGLDIGRGIPESFLTMWGSAMMAGLFRGAWDNSTRSESSDPRCKGHRHDLVIGSIIANEFGMKYQKGNEILQYAAPDDQPHNDTIVFFAQGL